MEKIKNSIAIKLSFLFTVVSITSMIFACIGILLYQYYSEKDKIVKEVQAYAILSAENFVFPLEFRNIQDGRNVLQRFKVIESILYVALFDSDDELFVDYKHGSLPDNYQPPLLQEQGYHFSSKYITVFKPVVFKERRIGTICVQSSLEPFRDLIKRNFLVMLIVVLLVAVFSMLLSFWLQHFISAPIQHLSNITQRIAESRDYSIRAVVHSQDEIGLLTNSLNSMLAQIQARDIKIMNSEKRFRTLFEQGADSIFVHLPSGHIVDVNLHACNTLGYTKEELIKKNILDFEKNMDREAIINIWNHITTESPHTLNGKFMTKDGTEIFVEIRIGLLEFETEKLFLSLVRDITKRVLAQEELKRSEENLQITLNSIGDAVIATDVNGIVLRMNPVAENLTGWKVDEAIGKMIDGIFKLYSEASDDPIEFSVKKIIQTQSILEFKNDTVLVDRMGVERIISASGAPIRNDKQNIVGTVLVFRDVSRQNQLEEQLRHSQKMDSIGQLAGGIAHDFNNMLSGIIGTTELLEDSLPEDIKYKQYIEMIINTAERASELTTKLLAFSRKGKVQSTPFDAVNSIKDAIALLERSLDRKISIVKNFNAHQTRIIGDPSLIQNAILNLGLNARDAMPNGGVLTIATENIVLDEEYCSSSTFDIRPGLYINIVIHDTGIGMDKETQLKIFDPFFTTKEVGKGTGLGLAAVYGTIFDHNGEITVSSEINVGTSFNLYLPVASVEVHHQYSENHKIYKGHGKILFIDDENILRLMASELLTSLGYQVILAQDGVDGVEKYKEYCDEIDLVILDLVMPKMNGKDCFFQLRKINPKVKVIMTSGFTKETSIHEMKKEGIHFFVKKPFRRAEMSKVISQVMNIY